jgi:hypothetical protein
MVANAIEEVVIIEPYPDPSIHPLKTMGSGKSYRNLEEGLEEEEEEREPPPSCYDQNGILTAELASFSEFKYYDGVGTHKEVEVQEEVAALPLGPTNYSRLGPPSRIAASAATVGASGITPPVPVVRDPEVLASLVDQLQQRRARLSSAKELPKTDQQVAPNDSAGIAAVAYRSNSKQKIKNRGALQSAVGPMLRILRNSENL